MASNVGPGTRVISALFAEMVGAAALAGTFDPEDIREILDPGIEILVHAVESAGGLVKDLAGEGMLAIFGAIATNPDDAAHAIAAGLSIATRFADYATRVRAEWNLETFGVRIGIESGVATFGDVGGGSRVEWGATGDVVNTAARLHARALPFTVLVGPAAYEATASRFVWGDPQYLELKGKTEPVVARVALSAAP